jgi:hypothetical protein
LKASGDKKEKLKKSSPSTLMCFVCGKLGHGAREFSLSKPPESALLVGKMGDDDLTLTLLLTEIKNIYDK